jgi:hypothetical protein
METEEKFEQWCIVEIVGYRKLGAKVTEAKVAGAQFIRLDIPKRDNTMVTQLYNPMNIFSLTPCTEDIARRFAFTHEPAPISVFDLQLPPGRASAEDEGEIPF